MSDFNALPEDLQKKLLQWDKNSPQNKQIQLLSDVADMVQELLGVMDEGKKQGEKATGDFGALLMDMRDSLGALKDKQDPQTPDYAKPVVAAVSKLEVSLTKALNAIDVKPEFTPNIQVDAPQVNVSPPHVDLKGVEKILKTDIPKAFREAIGQIPQTEVPDADYTEIISKLDSLNETLQAIEQVSRLKPVAPNAVGINANGAVVSNANPLPVSAEVVIPPITVDSAPTFKEDPSDAGEAPKYGHVSTFGDVQVDVLSLPNGVALETKQDDEITQLTTLNAKDFATQTTLALIKAKTDNLDVALSTRAVTGLTDTQLRATPVPVSGTVTIAPSGTQDENLKQVNGATVNVGTGTAGTGTQRVSVSSDSFPATQVVTLTSTAITSVVPGTGNTNLGAATNSARGATKTGIVGLAVKYTTPTGNVTTDGNYAEMEVDASQRLFVNGSTVTQPISAASLPLPTNAATDTLQTAEAVLIGAVTETAPASDTASSGLNGRLQRISQRLTSIIALIPGSLGQKARASSFAVTLSSEDITALTPPAAITGFATSALQTTGNSSLSSIDTKLSGTLATTSTTLPQPDLPSAPLVNQKTVTTAGTAVQLQTNTLKVGVIVQALSTNTGSIFVGPSSVSSSTGFELQPGQATSIGCSNTNAVWIDAATNGDKCCWIGS